MRIENIVYENVKANKEIDFYVPVRIDYKDNYEKVLFYYRLLNQKFSFIEFSIGSITRKIASITIISINDIVEVDKEVVEKLDIVGELGNPRIDRALFEQEHIITDNVNFKIMLHEKKIYFICNSELIKNKITMENFDIILNYKNDIVGYIFNGFTEKEWNEINESIYASISWK